MRLFGLTQPCASAFRACARQLGVLELGKHGFHVAKIVLGKITRIRARIRQDLVPLVEGLHNLQRAARAQGEPRVGFPLKRREVVKERRNLRGWLPFLLYGAAFAGAFVCDRLGLPPFPNALGPGVLAAILPELLVEPSAAIGPGRIGRGPGGRRHAKVAKDLEIGARFKVADTDFALAEDREGGCLNAAHRRELKASALRIEGGHRPCAIDTNEPVALAATNGGVAQRRHFSAGPEGAKAFANGFGGHALQPEAANGLFVARELHEIMKYQFALSSGIAGVDDLVEIRALEQALDRVEAGLRLFDGL